MTRNKLIAFIIGFTSVFSFSFEDSTIEAQNNIALGYQIGGNTLIGCSYELRVDNVFGVHIGGGLAGVGGGIRFHFNNDALSPYMDLNYKDAGFGKMESVAVEIGGTWKLFDESGPRASIGFQRVLFITDEFKYQLVGYKSMPDYLLAIQAGWAWEL